MTINRKLFSGEKSCSAKCVYCFAKWPSYVSQDTISVWRNEEIGPIVYPCCDSDTGGNMDLIQWLWRIAESNHHIYVSISTKKAFTASLLNQYDQLNQYLREYKKGFVKISVSVTSKYRIQELEPGTDSYDCRQEFFTELQHRGFETSLVFKPVLPFISNAEYKEIISDYPICNYFLLGSLYVDPMSEFHRTYICDKYDIEEKEVPWLDARPCWKYVSQDVKLQELSHFIRVQGKSAFYTDTDLISKMINDKETKL